MKGNRYPRVHLAIDNCFAIKRWVEPAEWMRVVREIGGVRYIQASTDNEIDPSYNTQSFRDDWVSEVKKYERKLDLKVTSLYSGYATYRTVGIASLSESQRRAMIDRYFKPIVDVAACLGAQVGNTLSACSDIVLQDPALFRLTTEYIENGLTQMARYAGQKGVAFSYEQMYTPTQGMWTIDGCVGCIKNVCARAGCPMYLTIDTAHQVGQRFFRKPSAEEIRYMIHTGETDGYRLPYAVEEAIHECRPPEKIEKLLERFYYWFAQPRDGDLYEWLAALGGYSPVVHLQQTDGVHSTHRPFTAQFNEEGIVRPKDVLKAIARSYEAPEEDGMPPRAGDIYLAFEIFFSNTESTRKILSDMRQSVLFWREYIPEDGLALDRLID